jgi:hypothetical protein
MDTSETPEQEQAGFALIARAGQRLRAVESWNEQAEYAHTDSQIAAVNTLTPYTPLEHQIRDFINVSVDSLRTAVLFVEKVEGLPITALYSLARSAVEATSYGIWLLKAGTLQKRAFYSLRLAYENNEDLEGLEIVLAKGGVEKPDRTRVRDRLKSLQQALSHYRTHDIAQTPTITSVVAAADRHVNRLALTGLQTWKTCSGVAHANGAVMRAILERIPTGEQTEHGTTFTMRSRATLVGATLTAAVENLEALQQLYIAGCEADPGIQSRRPRN